jgi:hypothetical protein
MNQELANSLLMCAEEGNIFEEQEKYYRLNIASSYLCNRCAPVDRRRMIHEIDTLCGEGDRLNKDVLELYAEICRGCRSSWIYIKYPDLFICAMQLIVGECSDEIMEPHEKAHANNLMLNTFRVIFEDLYHKQPC